VDHVRDFSNDRLHYRSGSAVLGAVTFAKGIPEGYAWLCLGLLTGLVAMANDVRSQLQQPPVDVQKP
jgi:hypothetical protein